MKRCIIAMATGIALVFSAFNAEAQTATGTQRMIVVLKPEDVARRVARVGERIDNIFVDQRYQKAPPTLESGGLTYGIADS